MKPFKLHLVEKFPDFDNRWPDADKLTWFEQFSHLMAFVMKREPQAVDAGKPAISFGERGYTKLT